jgi:hypothetical protein
MAVPFNTQQGNLSTMSGMPQIQAAFTSWMFPITLQIRKEVIVDGLVTYTTTENTFQGVIQPLNASYLMLKPEGQRVWQWVQIHIIDHDPRLDVNDEVIYNGVKYKIMAQNDWHLNGYLEYHAVVEYQP